MCQINLVHFGLKLFIRFYRPNEGFSTKFQHNVSTNVNCKDSTVLAFVVFMQVARAYYEYDAINLFSLFW